MSSTWFKGVRALKTTIETVSGYSDIKYILIAETAESNLINFNGGHDYHEWIMASGDYFEVMRTVCQGAVDFDSGSAKWKPNHKDSCGFIRMCKKALESAVEATTIPYNIKAVMFWGSKKYDYIIELFANNENVTKEKIYDEDCLVTKDVKTYIIIKGAIQQMLRDYNERVVDEPTTMKFKDWVNNHKDWYRAVKEVYKF